MRPLLVVLAALLVGSCGKGYDQEIILQIFRPQIATGPVVVTASVGSEAAHTFTPDSRFSFESCSTNQVRIIPKQVNGAYPPVQVTVVSGALTDTKTISVPVANPVIMVLGAIGGVADLVPKGTCAPTVLPDGGGPRRGIAEPCALDVQCEVDYKCLRREFESAVPPMPFPDGYCSKSCRDNADCPGGVGCTTFRNGLGGEMGRYCLKGCPCPGTNLNCSTDSLCVPKT